MIKIVYIGEDDYIACVKHGDVFFAEVVDNGKWYIIQNKNGEELKLWEDEVLIF